jgi:hypothetical protein
LLSADLTAAGERAKLQGISTVLDAPVPAQSKLELVIDLAPLLSNPPRKGLPEFEQAVEPRGAPELTAIAADLDRIVEASVTRSFRRSFLAAAILALLSLIPLAFAFGPGTAEDRRTQRWALAAALAVGAGLVGAELAGGALAYGDKPRLLPPCADRAIPATGVVDEAQRGFLITLDGLACRLDTTRERLVLSVAEKGVEAASAVAAIEETARRAIDLPSWLQRLLTGS